MTNIIYIFSMVIITTENTEVTKEKHFLKFDIIPQLAVNDYY